MLECPCRFAHPDKKERKYRQYIAGMMVESGLRTDEGQHKDRRRQHRKLIAPGCGVTAPRPAALICTIPLCIRGCHAFAARFGDDIRSRSRESMSPREGLMLSRRLRGRNGAARRPRKHGTPVVWMPAPGQAQKNREQRQQPDAEGNLDCQRVEVVV